MSAKAKAIKTLYRAKRITLDGVKQAVVDKIITEAEYMAALDDMAFAALSDGCTATNPRVPDKEAVMRIYRNLW